MDHDLFADRERAFEKQYAMEQERAFLAHARRDKLLGLWAAQRLGLNGEAAEQYARNLVLGDVEHPDDGDIVSRVLRDLERHGTRLTRADIEHELHHLEGVARAQIEEAAFA